MIAGGEFDTAPQTLSRVHLLDHLSKPRYYAGVWALLTYEMFSRYPLKAGEHLYR